jgi:hypothetical protein
MARSVARSVAFESLPQATAADAGVVETHTGGVPTWSRTKWWNGLFMPIAQTRQEGQR